MSAPDPCPASCPALHVEPDITRARTPDKALYLSEARWAQVRETVYARAWHWLGPLPALEAPCTMQPVDLLPGLLDEPLLLTRDASGTLHALSNVCTHRGKVLVEAPCRAEHIRCGYHSRRFELDGRLRHMPGFEGVCGFPDADDDLPRLPLLFAGGHAYTSLDPRVPFEAWAGGVFERLAWLPMHTWRHDPSRTREWSFDAHWALYVENYLEGLHIPFVHPGLNTTLDMSGYSYELAPQGVLQLARARPGEPALEPPPGHRDHGTRVAAYYFWLFPNLMLNVYPWGLSVNVVEPLTPARTRVRFESFVADPARLAEGAGGALDAVELEDEAAVCSVQRGLRARLYRRGRYAPHHEQGVHHFHRLLAQHLAGPG
ncbi:MAG: Carnitine monooxygenase oxygenase subunit [Pseudomonadota bacterium]|jgi:choline monooxygenase